MLLARRKGQNEAAPSQGIRRFAAEAPRHLAHGGEKPDMGAAEIQAIADGLPFASDNIGAHRSRRLDGAKRNNLAENRDQSAPFAWQVAANWGSAPRGRRFIIDNAAQNPGRENVGRKHRDRVPAHRRIGAHGIGIMRMEAAR